MIDWEKLYNKIISSPDSGIVERHHIIPKHVGGNNDTTNLVSLSRRKHILAHFVRYRWLRQAGDLAAYKMMTSQLTNPMLCDEIKIKHKQTMNSESTKRKSVESALKRWNCPEARLEFGTKRKQYIEEHPEFKQRLISQICTKEVYVKIGLKLKEFNKNNPEKFKRNIQIRANAKVEKNKTRTREELINIYSRGKGKDNPNWKGYCYLIKDDVIINTFESLNDFIYECDYHRCTIGVYRDSNKPFKKVDGQGV